MIDAVAPEKLPESLSSLRLKLSAFRPRDAAMLAKQAGTYSVAKFTLGIPLPYSTIEAKNWISGLAEKKAAGTEHIYALHLVSNPPAAEAMLNNTRAGGNIAKKSVVNHALSGKPRLIGAISLSIESEHRRIEIGYWLGEAFRGSGYAQEALMRLLPELFNAGFNRIYALCFPGNSDSMRLLCSLNFIREGRLRQHIVKWNEASDVICFGLTAARFYRKIKALKAQAARAQRL